MAYYQAWTVRDYLGMYSLLSPQSQALIDRADFIELYEESMDAAAVSSIDVKLNSIQQIDNEARLAVLVTLNSAVVGPIVRDHLADLIFSDSRWGVVWNQGLVMPELADGGRLYMDYRIPARGNIYDVNGRALAYQGTAITLGVIPGKIEDEPTLLNALSTALGKDTEEISNIYASALPDWYVPIGDVTGDTMQANYDLLAPLVGHGLVANERLTRLYTEDGIAAHIVGYSGYIPAESILDYKELGYRGDEQVGVAGLEHWGEPYLRGTPGGRLTVVGSQGEHLFTVQQSDPEPARAVYTTLDIDLQAAIEAALAEAIETHPLARAGSLVALDPSDGRVLAMASYPSFNPVVFDQLRVDSDQELGNVIYGAGRPLLNRATQGEYPPGSTFKIVTFSAALNSGKYGPETPYNSIGSWSKLGTAFIKYDWKDGGHGYVTMSQALIVSCNTCFYDAGFNMDQSDPSHLPETARQFGFGAPTGVVGIAESSGLIPDPEWKLENIGQEWSAGDAVHMSIGQGYVLVTPLQMARAIAAVANGGTLYRPYVIDHIGASGTLDDEPWPVEATAELPLNDSSLAAIQDSLRKVTSTRSGTATHRFIGFPVPVSGKTGTAESGQPEPHAWFAGYAPSETYLNSDGREITEPQIAVVVMIETSGDGSAVSAPIFRRALEIYYDISPQLPYPWINTSE